MPLEWEQQLGNGEEKGWLVCSGFVLCGLQDKGVVLASNQVQYSLLYRAPEKNGVLRACNELGITLIAYSPLAQGLLTGVLIVILLYMAYSHPLHRRHRKIGLCMHIGISKVL